MMREGSGRRSVAAYVAAFLTLLVIGPRAFAAQNECLLSFKGVPSDATNGGSVTCDDCNAACDTDGVNMPNKACTFNIAVCVNQAGAGCTAADIKKVSVKKTSGSCKLTGLKPTPNGTSSVCGAFTGVVVKEKKKGKKAGKCKIVVSTKSKSKPKQQDKDTLLLTCTPQTAATCPTTTTTMPSVTTTTTLPRCGDGMVTGNEQCDPPCGTGCGAGQICNSECQCVAAAPCACGTPDPATLHFTTMVGSGNCGTIQDGAGAQLAPLTCGGLYFGGGGDAVPLPAVVPDMGVSVTKTCCSGTDLTLAATTPTDTGSPRNCSGKDCFFGAPLPIPNTAENASAVSTCVINVIAQNAVGSMSCTDGSSSLDLPLTSEVYLFGDLLNGSTPDRPNVPGIQPCPICSKVCAGGANAGLPCAADPDCPASTCAAAPTCLGGPNHGMACTPSTTKTAVCDGGTKVDKPCTGDPDCPGYKCSTLRSPYPTAPEHHVPTVQAIRH